MELLCHGLRGCGAKGALDETSSSNFRLGFFTIMWGAPRDDLKHRQWSELGSSYYAQTSIVQHLVRRR